jgi:hypothetical protein
MRDHRMLGHPEIPPKREIDSVHQSDQQVPIAPEPCSNNAGQITEVQKAHIGFRRLEVRFDLF